MIRLEKQYAEAIIAQAIAENPNECCGIIAGKDGQAIKLFQATNAEASPYRYNIEPRELLRILREIDNNGWELLAIYHSHTHTQAYPSPTDIALAFYPEALYLIVSLIDPQRPHIRAFRILDGKVTEEELVIV